MQACAPGKREYEIAAEVMHEFRLHNADLSYLPIVGGGANGCILHYRENDAALRDGDLLLIDAGCEVDCYASDITRTFPVNGRFTPEQRALYDIVLEANHAAIERVKPGNHWNEPHEAAVRVITQGLVRLGLLKGKLAKLEESGAYRKFFMHRTGHWLGMDVHDVGDYKIGNEWRVFEPGMALTIEPGIYVAPGTPGVPEEYPRHRHPHRRRRGGDARWLRGADQRSAEGRRSRSSGSWPRWHDDRDERLRCRDRRRRHGRRQFRAGPARHEAADPADRKRSAGFGARSRASTNAPPRSAMARGRSSNPGRVARHGRRVGGDPLDPRLRCRQLRRGAARCARSRASTPLAM